VPLNEDGFFLEAHVKLRPVDFATEGVFMCGLAHSPKSIEETISQAKAAASRAASILTKDRVLVEGKVAVVNKNLCSGCGTCAAVCAYQAVQVDGTERVAVVNEALCKGCGSCSSACPSGAIDVKGFTDNQIYEALEAFQAEAV
ncbi:MAG: 4Fe-4S binding protein, partial [bacterium]